MKYSLSTKYLFITLVLLSSFPSKGQWTSSNGFAESANPTLNIKSESINRIFFWNDSLLGCNGQSYVNLGGAYSSIAFYANLKRNTGQLNNSYTAPRNISVSQPYHLANSLEIYPEFELGLSEERVLSNFGTTSSYQFGCFKLSTSDYLWQIPDTNRLLSKPSIINGDTLIWVYNLKNNQPENVKQINMISGDTVQIFPYSNISPKAVPNYYPSNPYFLGESGDSIFIGYLYSNLRSFDSIGVRLGINKIRLYSKANLNLIDSFDSKVIDLSTEMVLNSDNEGIPQYTDRSHKTLTGSSSTAQRTVYFTNWKRDTLHLVNFYTNYYINQTTGDTILPSIEVLQQNGFTLLDILHSYPNPFDPLFENIANRLIMFDSNFNKKYEIASVGFNTSKYIMSGSRIDKDGAIYFIGQQNSTRDFFDIGKIDPNGNHPWFKNFVGQEELSLRPLLNLFPNPSRGQLTLSNYPYDFNKVQLALFDVQGRIMDAGLQADLNGLINLPSHLSNGFYYLKIKDNLNTDETFKVLLSR